ncbi:bcl-2 homologous antagonist/killer-like isoform X2 [Brienomyrus brachyistius]|uniref:bcl-2 homologous antagonist/killer-like isoform X2 n=1 Tax=Brienomyrus brachyistius TaxID=42636 RepID=UPI0020B37A13|nr:bcl-2 homologous antagonist/killer-like isoform X2 [Brienomyrus brachyistius]
MATGGREDPLKPNRKHPSQDELHTDPEEEVVQESEAVFCSYVRYRYHQEMEQGEQSTLNPEIIALQPDESSPMCRVGQQLAIIGDDINRRYDFSGMLSQLSLTPENAYDYFCKIANSWDEGAGCCSRSGQCLRELHDGPAGRGAHRPVCLPQVLQLRAGTPGRKPHLSL